MAAVSWTIGNVNPSEVILVDSLVDRQFELSHEGVELSVGFSAASGYVGCLAKHVLAGWHPSHCSVKGLAPVSTVDVNGLSPCLTQRVKHVIDKCREIVDYLL